MQKAMSGTRRTSLEKARFNVLKETMSRTQIEQSKRAKNAASESRFASSA